MQGFVDVPQIAGNVLLFRIIRLVTGACHRPKTITQGPVAEKETNCVGKLVVAVV